MTGEAKTASEENPMNHSDTKTEQKTEAQSDAKAEADANAAKGANADEAPVDPQQKSVFSGWGFDVNAVAGNIGGLFGSPDDVEPRSDEGATEKGDDITATAANIANVASTEIEHASKAAQETFGKAAEEIGKGWGTFNTFLDDMLAPKVGGEETVDEKDMTANFHSLFPELDEEDQVVDHFQCSLLQKYRCYLNNATPEKAYPLKGRLYISTTHVAMYITDDGGVFGNQPFGFTIAFTDAAKIQRGANAMLKLVTKSQQSYIFTEFESDSHFSGALSLLEHMRSEASSSKPPPARDVEGSAEKPAAG